MHAALSLITHHACRIDEGIYVLNPFYRRINFYAQQVRAIALVDGIVSAPNFDRDFSDIVVIGAGIAGTTCAAAAIARGLSVTLIDKVAEPVSGYQRSTREVHPNIIMWPFHKKNSFSNLPFLNWFCGPASTVADTIREQWIKHFSPRCTPIRGEVQSVKNAGATKSISLKDGRVPNAHTVIVCAGWMPETLLALNSNGIEEEVEVPTRYWTGRLYDDQPILVSRTGDGGLIDAASQVFGIKAVAICRVIADAIEKRPDLLERIHSIETRAAELYNVGEIDKAFDILKRFYSVLRLDADIENQILPFTTQRSEPIDLIHRDPSPYSPLSSPINRILVAHMINSLALVNAELGKVDAKTRAEGTTYSINRKGAEQFWSADRAVIRHGAKSAARNVVNDDKKFNKLKIVDFSILNSTIPNNIKWKNTTTTYWKSVLPAMNSRKTKGAFIDWLRESVPKMIHGALPVGAHVGRISMVAGPNNSWVACADHPLPHDVKSLFPATGKGFKVVLGESATQDFKRLG